MKPSSSAGFDQTRLSQLNQHQPTDGPVLYWMIRDQRAHDNWALEYAVQQAKARKQPVLVVVALRSNIHDFSGTARMLEFMLQGLKEVETELLQNNISFQVRFGDPVAEIFQVVEKHKVGEVVLDFYPLRVYRAWHKQLATKLSCRVTRVDAHNIVPCLTVSQKQEYAARTIRPKLNRLLPEYLIEFPKIQKHPFTLKEKRKPTDWARIRKAVKVDEAVTLPSKTKGGSEAGFLTLKSFLETRLSQYDSRRNDPNADALSRLSPYLHFGHVAAQRIALEVSASQAAKKDAPATEAFLEELIVRKELSDNYCWYQPHYDSSQGFPDWAKKTLADHAEDAREHVYTQDQFEKAKTRDELWNAAQIEMMNQGKMHGYMRMYWAKKILEWSSSPDEAQKIAIYLNDKYELDGRDPNGYTGIAWSIGGVHDRPWFERPIFGKIRYMNANGARKKFDVDAYISKHRS